MQVAWPLTQRAPRDLLRGFCARLGRRCAVFAAGATFAAVLAQAAPARAQATAGEEAPGDENALGRLLITGDAREQVTPLAILPSLSPELEDVIVRGVVSRSSVTSIDDPSLRPCFASTSFQIPRMYLPP